MTRWLVLSAFVAATAVGACRGRDRDPSIPAPSAMPVEQTDPAPNPSNSPPHDSPGAAGAATSTDPWAQPATPSRGDTAPNQRANPNDPWAQPAPSSPDTTPNTTTPNTAAPNTATPSTAPDAKSNAAAPTLPFPPPGTAGKTVPPTHPVKPDEPGTVEPDSRDGKADSSAGSGDRDFGRSP